MRFTIFQDSQIGGCKYKSRSACIFYSKDVLLMVIADGMAARRAGGRDWWSTR